MKGIEMEAFGRHGDVVIYRLDGLAPEFGERIEPDKGKLVLAYGEATGHSHSLPEGIGELYKAPNMDGMYLNVTKEGAQLGHEEHKSIAMPVGLYYVGIKRQHSPNGWDPVRD